MSLLNRIRAWRQRRKVFHEGMRKAKLVLCPFHQEKTASCGVWADGTYHCFSCGAEGTDFYGDKDRWPGRVGEQYDS